jgi:hypothetical protein
VSRATQVASIERQFGASLASASALLGVERAALLAVLAVETGGLLAVVEGRPLARLEAHLLVRAVPSLAPSYRWDQDEATERDGVEPWENQERLTGGVWVKMHTSQAEERAALAQAIDEHGAPRETVYRSASWGCAQILGSNCARVGFASAVAMVEAFERPEAQLAAFLRFVEGGRSLLPALRGLDFLTFAREYNGPGMPGTYAGWMREAYAAALAQPAAPIATPPPAAPAAPTGSTSDPDGLAGLRPSRTLHRPRGDGCGGA